MDGASLADALKAQVKRSGADGSNSSKHSEVSSDPVDMAIDELYDAAKGDKRDVFRRAMRALMKLRG